jgi:hypothetical protein
MKFIARLALVAAFIVPAAPLFAAEGVLLVQKVTTGTQTTTTNVQVEQQRMRDETVEDNGEKQAMVFDAVKQTMTTINYGSKTYSEITKAEADQMGAQVSDAMAQMQAQMASMPPAQRAQIEAMMRGRGPAVAQAVKTEYRRAGSDKVGKWACDKYEGYRNNEKVSEVCTVDPKVLGFSLSDFEITRQMSAFFQKMMPPGSAQGGADRMFSIGASETGGFTGMPIRQISYNKGQVSSTSELSEVSRQNFPASSYAVPPGFQKQEMFGGPGRGRGRGRQ